MGLLFFVAAIVAIDIKVSNSPEGGPSGASTYNNQNYNNHDDYHSAPGGQSYVTTSSAKVELDGVPTLLIIILFTCWIICWMIPFICSTFTVYFTFTDKKDYGLTALFRDFFMPWSYRDVVLQVRTNDEPNSSFLFDFCYGSLANNMDQMHTLHHMIHDDLTCIVQPENLADISETDTLMLNGHVPPPPPSFEMVAGKIQSTKFGKSRYELISETTGSVLTSHTRINFYDQVVVFQEEKKILCWPMWFSQRVVPKYKFKDFSISKTDPKLAFVIGIVCFAYSIVCLAMKAWFPGVVLLLCTGIAWAIPFIFQTFIVRFTLTHSKEEGFARAIRDFLFCFPWLTQGSENLSIFTGTPPDEAAIKAYIYGPMVKNMETIHTLNHLIHDDITHLLEPKSLASVKY